MKKNPKRFRPDGARMIARIRLYIYSVCAAAIWAATAAAQSVPVFQSGLVQPNDVAKYERSGSIRNAGTIAGDNNGMGVNPFAATDFGQLGICSNSGPATGPYNQICLGHSTGGRARLEIASIGGGPSQTFEICVDGLCSSFPFAGSGNVIGPASSAIGDVALFANITGNGLKDATQGSLFPVSAVQQYGAAAGNGTPSAPDNLAAFTAIAADTTSPIVYFPPGIYRLSCGHAFNFASATSLTGAGKGVSIIRLDPGCSLPYTSSTFLWTNKSRVQIKNLTFDLNTPGANAPGPIGIPIQVYANAGTTILGPLVDNIEVINGKGATWLLAIIAQAGGVIDNPIVTNSYFTLVAPFTQQNQCIALYASQATGMIINNVVSKNVCKNTGIQIDGVGGVVDGNNVSGYAYGTGLFGLDTQAGWPRISCSNQTFSNNVVHDGTLDIDQFGFSQAGMEIDCPYSTVSGNISYNNGGPGYRNFADFTTWTGNKAYNNGKLSKAACTSAGGVDCRGVQAGFFFLQSGAGASQKANSSGTTFVGNLAFDDSPGTQIWGYVMDTALSVQTLRGNNLVGLPNATPIAGQAILVINGTLSEDPAYQFSQVTGSLPSFDFPYIDTATYHQWQLQCSSLVSSTPTTIIYIQFGIGTPPAAVTWRTAGSYAVLEWVGTSTGTPALTAFNNFTALGIPVTGGDVQDATSGDTTNFTAWINNLSTSVGFKSANIIGSYGKAPSAGINTINGTGTWKGDTNPLNAIRVVPYSTGGVPTGNLAGQCSLQGRY